MYGKTFTQEEITTTNGGDPSKVAVVKAGPAPRVSCMLPPSIACTAAVVVVSTILTSRPCLAKRFSFWAMKYKLVPGLTPAWPTVILMVCAQRSLERKENRAVIRLARSLDIAVPPFRSGILPPRDKECQRNIWVEHDVFDQELIRPIEWRRPALSDKTRQRNHFTSAELPEMHDSRITLRRPGCFCLTGSPRPDRFATLRYSLTG